MFAIKNFTGIAFFTRIGRHSVEFAAGMVEEITLNVTVAGAANAAELPENFNLNVLSKLPKDQIITSTSVAISSTILQKSNLVGLIAGATPNLLI